MSRSIVALMTDFGVRDHYVAAMKAVILSICPDVTLVDITHEIPPQDVCAGAYELAACYRFFPASTIFLAVVDPGVGSQRHAMVAETSEHRFVAPDNGLLTAVFAETPPRRVVELTERRYARPTLSRTFEGRDRFAPAAAWLAKGVDLSAVGRPLAKYELLELPQPVATEGAIAGEVRHIDRFGNLVTNIDRKIVDRVGRGGGGPLPGGDVQVSIGDRGVGPIVATYAEVPRGAICALFGSSDHLEIAANGASAAASLGAGRGAAVTIVFASASPSTLA